jgi:hypothetical protein
MPEHVRQAELAYEEAYRQRSVKGLARKAEGLGYQLVPVAPGRVSAPAGRPPPSARAVSATKPPTRWRGEGEGASRPTKKSPRMARRDARSEVSFLGRV